MRLFWGFVKGAFFCLIVFKREKNIEAGRGSTVYRYYNASDKSN